MKKLYLLLTLAILLISCEKEEISSNFLNEIASSPPIELLKFTELPPEIREHLDIINNAASQKGEQIFGNIDKRIVIKRIQSGKDFSYTFSLLKIELAKNQLNNYYFDNLVFKDNKNSDPIVIRYIPTIEWQEGERDIRKFSGQIVFNTLEGKKINRIEVENGMQVASDEKQVCHYTLESVVLQCYGGEGSMLDQPYNCYKVYTYKESCTSGGSPGEGGGGTGTGPGDPPSIPSEPTEGWEPGGSNGGGIDPSIQDTPLAMGIDDKDLSECLKVILNKLIGHDHGVGKFLMSFEYSSSYNWLVKSGPTTNPNSIAQTDTNYNTSTNTASTTFNSGNFPLATDLSWAKTILHEAAHAYVVNLSKDWSLTLQEKNELIYGNWLQVYINKGHNFMAENYISLMADVLQEYGQEKGYTMGRQFYEDLSWGGLESTPAFQFKTTTTKNRIKNVIKIELDGKDIYGISKPKKGQNAGC